MTRENRTIVRRQLHYPATLTLKDRSKVHAETIDLSLGGISLLAQEQIRPGQYCAVMFEAHVQEVLRRVVAVGQIIYCLGPAHEGYTVGLQFLDIDPGSIQAIRELLI